MTGLTRNLTLGALNLLQNCAGMQAGQRLLIVYEDAASGIYGADIAREVATVAQGAGIVVETEEVPFLPDVADPSAALTARMASADRTLFLARLGDQIRFRPSMGALDTIVSYAVDTDMLASGFGQAHFGGLLALKSLVNDAVAGAEHIRVTCPLGTDFSGGAVAFPQEGGDCTVTRFPMSVFTPVPAHHFSDRIAQAGFLTGTGSHYYAPYSVALDDILVVHFEGNRITGFDGSRRDVQTARAHYEHVARTLGIDPWFVHSWHAGIHPGLAYTMPAADNPERWSAAAFGNPRVLHFHTCGQYPPGEISLNVIDPTVDIDGVKLWDHGRLCPERLPGGQAIFDKYDCLAAVFANPETQIGLGPEGRLSLVRQVAA